MEPGESKVGRLGGWAALVALTGAFVASLAFECIAFHPDLAREAAAQQGARVALVNAIGRAATEGDLMAVTELVQCYELSQQGGVQLSGPGDD